jgi:hypothetical protein
LRKASFLRVSPATANKPVPSKVRVAGSGTGEALRLIVAPATVPLPPLMLKMPLSVDESVPVTTVSKLIPRKVYKAGLTFPAMKLAEKADCPGAPPLKRVRLALWKVPVNRATTPDPRFPITVIEPPGLKLTAFEPRKAPWAVVQLIVPFVIDVFGGLALSCTEVKRDERFKT